MTAFLILVLLIVSGCASFPAPTAQERCAGFGFRPGTESFAVCAQSVSQQRQAARDAAALLILSQPPPVYTPPLFYPMRVSPSFECTTERFLNTLQTRCR